MFSIWVYSLFIIWLIYAVCTAKMWFSYNRIRALLKTVLSIFRASFPNVMLTVVYVGAIRWVYMMAVANVPMFSVPMMFYSYVLFNAILFWTPIVCYALYTNPKGFISHMLPYGAPTGLMLFLPLVEIFSQVIRPLTLTIRFATNLSAGHIMMFMFSYFSLLSSALAPFLYVVLVVLLLMEIFIAFLQSYIFLTLLGLYLEETL